MNESQQQVEGGIFLARLFGKFLQLAVKHGVRQFLRSLFLFHGCLVVLKVLAQRWRYLQKEIILTALYSILYPV